MLSLSDIVNVKVGIGRGVFEAPGATVIGGKKPSSNLEILKLFSNNEQGFFYDTNDLSTMYQDAAGTVPVTAVGQPVGLALDKSKGLLLGSELALPVTPFTVYRDATTNTLSPVIANLEGGKTYLITATVGNTSPILADFRVGANYANTVLAPLVGNVVGITTYRVTVLTSGALRLHGISPGTNVTITSVSVHEEKGNHAYQATSSMRPLLVASPQRLDYDTVDDKLTTTLPAQLTGCTVVRAVPNVGTQILTGQTIPATYEDNKDHCGLIVINRALTPSETSAIAAEFNKRAGV